MKGIVFSEFQELVESQYGLEVFDQLVESCDLPSDGVYTAVGTYDYRELLQLVEGLSQQTGAQVSELVREFGRHLFSRFAAGYARFFGGVNSAIEFLGNVEDYIYVEVRKLYPDAELPGFEFQQLEEGRWALRYFSSRPFADLAQGLIEATVEHFGDPLSIEREETSAADGTEATFILSSKVRVPECLT